MFAGGGRHPIQENCKVNEAGCEGGGFRAGVGVSEAGRLGGWRSSSRYRRRVTAQAGGEKRISSRGRSGWGWRADHISELQQVANRARGEHMLLLHCDAVASPPRSPRPPAGRKAPGQQTERAEQP